MQTYRLAPNINNSYTSCFEAATNSVIYNLFSDYPSVFTMYWGFLYRKHEPVNIREKFIVGGLYAKSDDYYKRLYGLEFHTKTPSKMEPLICEMESELLQDRAVILAIDTYDCPWNMGYRKFHLEHFVVITGIDRQKSQLLCHDAFCGQALVPLAFQEIEKMDSYKIFTYTVEPSQKENHSPSQLLRNASEYYLFYEKSHRNIVGFAEELAQTDLFKSLSAKDISLICLDPFFVKMKGVVSSRQNLLYFLKYNFKSTFFSFESQLEDICKQYNDAYLILLKAISRKGNQIYIKNASQLLISAAKCEERLSREILDLM